MKNYAVKRIIEVWEKNLELKTNYTFFFPKKKTCFLQNIKYNNKNNYKKEMTVLKNNLLSYEATNAKWNHKLKALLIV